jgi:hypothetical protein
MTLRSAALLGALALAGFAGPASAQTYRADEIKKSVNQADLETIIGAIGHTVIERGTAPEVYALAQTDTGFMYFLQGSACDMNNVPGCQGIMMQARFDLPATTTLETLSKANLVQPVLNTSADFDAKTLVFTRYQVLDHGVTMANIRENVVVLLSLIQETFPIAAGEQ